MAVTQWKDRDGVVKEAWTEPNSLLVIKAGTVEHRVTPITKGKRQIVKAVFVVEGAKKYPWFESTMQY